MTLEEYLMKSCQDIGVNRLKKMFGWMCICIDKNFIGGYKLLDDSIIIMFIVLSPNYFQKAITSNRFQKFEFGKTWVEVELNNEDDIDYIFPFLKDAKNYIPKRANIKLNRIHK